MDKPKKECPENKVLKKEFNRCVLKKGVNGRKIEKEMGCFEGRIKNPKTERCVSINGVLGKKISKNKNKENASAIMIQNAIRQKKAKNEFNTLKMEKLNEEPKPPMPEPEKKKRGRKPKEPMPKPVIDLNIPANIIQNAIRVSQAKMKVAGKLANANANIIQNAIRQKRARNEFNTLKNKKSNEEKKENTIALYTGLIKPDKKQKQKEKKIVSVPLKISDNVKDNKLDYNVDNYKTAYEVLGISENSTEDEIRSKYKKLLFNYHPDKCKYEKEECAKMSSFIANSYEILKDNDTKKKYDKLILNKDDITKKKILKGYYVKEMSNVNEMENDEDNNISLEREIVKNLSPLDIKKLKFLNKTLFPILNKNDIEFLKKYEKKNIKELDILMKNKKFNEREINLLDALKDTYDTRIKVNYKF